MAYIVPWLGVTEKAADAPAKKSQRKGANVLTSFTTAMSVTDVCLGDERRENVSSGAAQWHRSSPREDTLRAEDTWHHPSAHEW